jgi:hypothetical protein
MVRLKREPLLGMAYWLYTLVKALAGGFKQAATTFNIDPAVLIKLRHLSITNATTRLVDISLHRHPRR